MNTFQASSKMQGDTFERHVEEALARGGWTITGRNVRVTELKLEVDLIATDPNGVVWWVESKGSWMSNQNGAKRSDTTKKAIATAALLATCPERCPYLLVTSDLPPTDGTPGLSLARAIHMGWFTKVIELPIGAIGLLD